MPERLASKQRPVALLASTPVVLGASKALCFDICFEGGGCFEELSPQLLAAWMAAGWLAAGWRVLGSG